MTRLPKANILALLVALALLVVAVSACGGDDGGSVAVEPDTTASTTATTPPTTTVSPLGFTSLSDGYGCGYGFAIGSPDQDLALIIYSNVGSVDGPDVTAPITFPSPDWTAELQMGTDLFANWCDDVIEPNEPTPVVDKRLPLIKGRLTVDANATGASCDGTAVNGLLRDAAVEIDGEQIDLPDELTLTNTGWGCFAG